jgi:hypothetical protein
MDGTQTFLATHGDASKAVAGDTLLIDDEQMTVLTQGDNSDQDHDTPTTVVRAVNISLGVEHKVGAKIYRLRREANTLAESGASVLIGRCGEQGYQSFKGTIDEVRIWKIGRMGWQIAELQGAPPPDDALGLIANWRFEDGVGGKTAFDDKGQNHGHLIHNNLDKIPEMWTPSELTAMWTLYINGVAVEGVEGDLATYGGYGDVGASFGARPHKSNSSNLLGWPNFPGLPPSPSSPNTAPDGAFFRGRLDEVRIWNKERTAQEIHDNLYRPLSDNEEDLVGYWRLDASTPDGLVDQTIYQRHGVLHGPQFVTSTAPIGNEGPEVLNAYGGISKPLFNVAITSTPVAIEYGDMQTDASGARIGVMKRCYAFFDNSAKAVQMSTGFKVGDMDLQFVGQIQTAPTLIGYIEGQAKT